MAKNYSNRNRKRKALIAMLCALSVTCTGLAAACAPNDGDDEPSTAVTAKEDTQLLKNGNFEHFDIPDKAIHLIKNANSWTLSGDTSVKSGIIGTSEDDWGKLTDSGLADKLNYNNDLSSDSDDYVNYNSMRSRDIPYKDTYAAMLEADKVKDSWITKHNGGYEGYFDIQGDEESGYTWNGEEAELRDGEFYIKDTDGNFTKLIRKEFIGNPGTHYGNFKEEDGKYYYGGTQVYADDKGNYYLDEKLEKETVGNVLMIHNAGTSSDRNGLQQYYTSNTISLEAHTSAEISLWVKTSDLRFDKGDFATAAEEDLGAYIEVLQTVASTTIDSFKIKAINTQNIITSAENDENVTLPQNDVNNGWVKYTVYVNACDFANTSIQLRLGLGGEPKNEGVTGYAFFDDVQVTKYRSLEADATDEASENKCTYKDYKKEIEDNGTSCTLTSEEDDKIFHADVTNEKNATKVLHPYDFHYFIDLASVTNKNNQKHTYAPITFGNNVEVGLTTEKDSKDNEYAAAKNFEGAKVSGVVGKTQDGDYKLPKDVKARPTDKDLITVFGSDKKEFTASDFNSGDYSKLLNNIVGDKYGAHNLPAAAGNTLVMFSAWGAPYTATVTDADNFKLAKDEYLLVSFWVKTSDMNGNTAATAKIYELDEKGLIDKNSVQTLTVDTTDKTTDFEDEKDIYNGWVQCFFFVKNETGKTEDPAKTFKIDFSFGATEIISTTSYESGFAAIANLQVLKINEDIYDLASAGDNTALFSFTKDTEKDGGTAFDEVKETADINKGIALPSSYDVANGDNAPGAIKNKQAGLINRDVFKGDDSEISDETKNAILDKFAGTSTLTIAEKWQEAFGENCYQPLIIINNLREYAVSKDADKDTYKNYWIKNADDTYTKVAADAEYDENATYYSLAANYGFIGKDKTVSSNGREVISVRVKVTGDAVAYIYLINTDDTKEALSYTTPSITYWYDEEGNVLDQELDEDWTTAKHLEHIVYTLREDGLYDGKDGKLYGNLNNLVESYKDSKYERVVYYDKDGNLVEGGYDYVSKYGEGKTYYTDKNGTVANHYLCTTDGTHVYEFINGKYYYVEITKTDGKTTETTNLDKEVNNFETTPRYTKPEIAEELAVEITKADCDRLGANSNGWVTVNFVISTGSEEKNYRLELWSGERDNTGVSDNGTYKEGAVAFDYVHGTVSESRIEKYEAEIINAYNSAIIDVDAELLKDETLGKDANIADYEAFLNSDKLTATQKADIKTEMGKLGYVDADGNYTYKASYYTYTLYDSAAYVPFNEATASEGETGYNYDPSSFSEQLAYFEIEDKAQNQKNVFVDYSAVDQSITKNTVSDDDDTEEEETANTAELGLYISSIVLVVVLLITLVSILVTQYIRKRKKTSSAKNSEKNAYRKRDRYVKKLHLVKDEMVEPENGESETNEVPAEEVTPVENEVTEVPAEETAEPEPVEETTEEPVEKTDGEDKE